MQVDIAERYQVEWNNVIGRCQILCLLLAPISGMHIFELARLPATAEELLCIA